MKGLRTDNMSMSIEKSPHSPSCWHCFCSSEDQPCSGEDLGDRINRELWSFRQDKSRFMVISILRKRRIMVKFLGWKRKIMVVSRPEENYGKVSRLEEKNYGQVSRLEEKYYGQVSRPEEEIYGYVSGFMVMSAG